MPEDRLKKINEENILQQRTLVQAMNAKLAAERLIQAQEQKEAEQKKLSSMNAADGGMMGSSSGLGVPGRRDEKRGTKRGRDEEGVSY